MPIVYVVGLLVVLGMAAMNRQAPEPVQLSPIRTSPMHLPPDYRETYVNYLTVDRIDRTVRRVYISPDALDNLQAGEPLPRGTQIVIEAFHAERNIAGQLNRDANGHFIMGEMFPTIHAAEKRADWPREAIASSTLLGEWNFETFDSETFQPSDENRADCFTCHDTLAFRRDFIITRAIIDQFLQDGDVQYFYCNRPNRAPCV
jgi:hypothetical protein